jgi:GDP-mannose transporter
VFSSVVAAWSDVTTSGKTKPIPVGSDDAAIAMNYVNMLRSLNAGYFWMLANCLASAAYVSPPIFYVMWLNPTCFLQVLLMRKKIKGIGFSDWDSMFYK